MVKRAWSNFSGRCAGLRRAFERIEDWPQRRALELQRGLVYNEARRNLHDLFDFDELATLMESSFRPAVEGRPKNPWAKVT